MIKTSLQSVKASGRREGWWFLVREIAANRGPGLRQFDGERLAVGECELAPMSVLLMLRPVGPARSDQRTADVMSVDPATGNLIGVAYGLPWDGKAGNKELIAAVRTALQARDSFNQISARIREAVSGLVGKPNTEEAREKVAKELAAIVQQAVPPAKEIVVRQEPFGDQVSVSFRIAAEHCLRLIRCAVPCYGGDGDVDFYFLCVHVPMDYVNVDEDMESDEPHHHAAARKAAIAQGFDGITADTPVYDDMDYRWARLIDMFDWDTAVIYNLKGECYQ